MVMFSVLGRPQGKGRPRFSRRSGTVYTPKKTMEYEEKIRQAYLEAGGKKYASPIVVIVNAYFLVPASWSKSIRRSALNGVFRPGKRPDIDNILKAVMDALNGVAYLDDKQVIECYCTKRYAEEEKIQVSVNTYGVEVECL